MLHVTALYAALLALLMLGLALQVILLRRRQRVGIGHGGDEALARAIRVHANFTEYVPMSLLLLALAELNHALPEAGLHGAGVLLLLSRLLHARGLGRDAGKSFGRFYGTALNWTVITVLSLALLWPVVTRPGA